VEWAEGRCEEELEGKTAVKWVSVRTNIKPKKRVLGTVVKAAFQKRGGFGWHSGKDGRWVVVGVRREWDDRRKRRVTGMLLQTEIEKKEERS
jgi:hypothetical protein